MQPDLSQELVVGIGSYVMLDDTLCRIGHPHDLRAAIPTISPGTAWGDELVGKHSGDVVRLIDRCEGRRQPSYISRKIEIVNYIDPRLRTVSAPHA